MPIGTGTAILGGGVLSGITSLIGGGKQAGAAEQAAQAQLQATIAAQQAITQRFEEAKALEMPFIQYGQGAIPALTAGLGIGAGGNPLTAPLTQIPDTSYAPFQITNEQLAQTPGFQFQKYVGDQSIANQQAAKGIRIGGGFSTAEEQFATGLAQSTWQQQLQSYIQQYQTKLQGQQLAGQFRGQTYNMLAGALGTGASTATSLAGAGINVGGQVANLITAGGAAQASGITGAANALTAGLSGVGGAASNTALLYALNQSGALGSPAGGPNAGTAALDASTAGINQFASLYGAQTSPLSTG